LNLKVLERDEFSAIYLNHFPHFKKSFFNGHKYVTSLGSFAQWHTIETIDPEASGKV
jgi:hypothetical protein